MIDFRSWKGEKQSARFIVPFPRNGSRSSTRQSEAHFRLSVYPRTRSCYALQIFVLPSRLYINDRFPPSNLDLWIAASLFRVPLVIDLFPPDVFEIPSLESRPRKPENLFQRISLFLLFGEQSADRFE